MPLTNQFTETFGVEHMPRAACGGWGVPNSLPPWRMRAAGLLTALTQPTPADLAREIDRVRG